MKQDEIPEAQDDGRNLAEYPHIEVEGDVYRWCEERDGEGEPTQVHVGLTLLDKEGKPLVTAIMAFKSGAAVDRHIALLMRERNAVFGAGDQD